MLEPWEHGTVLRATPYPHHFAYNLVHVERDPSMDVAELAAFADRALAGLEHRRIDVEPEAVGARLRPGFREAGWMTERLVWMRHERPLPPAEAGPAVEQVPFELTDELRAAWGHEDFPGVDLTDYLAGSREIAQLIATQAFVVREGAAPVGYSVIEHIGTGAEVTQVFVHPEHRGRGIGTALTRAAIEAAGDVSDLWIMADDEGRPKQLYARLGFEPACTLTQFLRLL